ncbi:MAG: CbrC family protein [Cytophagales bacterium]|jgi:uncharacterized protein CbrC (UPF0167 family)|nr:CbrC family protein [Cytophagales bacterium]
MRNSVNRYLRNDIFSKGYFCAPCVDLMNFKYGRDNCPVCKEVKSKFVIPPFGEYAKICLDCLSNTDIKFSHDSECGPVVWENVPSTVLADFGNVRDYVAERSIRELLITPAFTSIQGGIWKVHCKDFMVFRGIWIPCDFTANSQNNNGKKLFLEMTDRDCHRLWDDCELNDDETEKSWEHVQFYAFECRHCGKLRGYWDCS